MKDLGNKIIWYAVGIAIVLWFAWGLIDMFGGMDNVKMIGNGSLLVGFLKLPFCLFGGIQILRAFYSLIGKDAKAMDDSKTSYFIFVLYLVSTIAGIMFLVDAYNIIK